VLGCILPIGQVSHLALACIFFTRRHTVVAHECIPQVLEDSASVIVYDIEHLCPKVERVGQGRDPDKRDPRPRQCGEDHVVQQADVHIGDFLAYYDPRLLFTTPSTSKGVFEERERGKGKRGLAIGEEKERKHPSPIVLVTSDSASLAVAYKKTD